jgi:serine/threonine-protein kinase
MHQIGVGVLGPVFRAYPQDGEHLVALKAFLLDLVPEQAIGLAEALTEIVATGLSHPSVVSPLGAGVERGIPYLAFSYASAESLDVAMSHYAPASIATALPMVVQLASAVDAAHAKGLPHGALHLRDVFVTPDLAQICGFGIVPAIERVGRRGEIRPPYAAPERLAGDPWGAAADRYSLAAIAFELLTGARAGGEERDTREQLTRVGGGRRADGLMRVFATAMAQDPDERPSSAVAFAEALADAVGWSGSGTGDMTKRNIDQPAVSGKKADELDWSERALDRGEPQELRPPDPYEPRPVGAPPGFVRPDGLDPDAAADDLDLFDTGETLLSVDAGPAGRAPSREEGEGVLGAGSSRRDGWEPLGPPKSLFDQLDEPAADEFEAGQAEHDVDGDDGNEAVEEDLEAVQARYRTLKTPQESPESPDGYQAIPVSGLRDRLRVGEEDALEEDALEEDELEEDELEEEEDRSDAFDDLDGADEREDHNGGFLDHGEDDLDELVARDGSSHLGSVEASDRGGLVEDEYDYEPDRVSPDELERDLNTSSRTLAVVPLVLIAVVTAVAAFVIGFGLMTGEEEVVRGSSGTSEGTAVAAGVVLEGTSTEESLATPPGREFSEASVLDGMPGDADTFASAPVTEAVPPQSEPAVAPVMTTSDAPTVAEPAAIVQPADGRLLVRSTPAGAEVLVDSEPRGQTPLALEELPYGSYTVRVVLDGYEPDERSMEITPLDRIASVDVRLLTSEPTSIASSTVGSIYVDTRPSGVEVWLDDRLVGETPMLISEVMPGSHELEFRSDGYRDWTTTVQVDPAQQARVTASLDYSRP